MKTELRRFCGRLVRDESGALVIIVMMFTLVFLGMGIGLFYLVKMNTASADLERRDTKSFNVAEAGLDAGMLALREGWPDTTGDSVGIDETTFRSDFDSTEYPDPTRSPSQDFIEVSVYDNSDGSPSYDANGDGLMYVESEANVGDARHRILVLAEQQSWDLNFPQIAMFAAEAGANGQGLRIRVDPLNTSPLPLEDGVTGERYVPAYYGSEFGKGVDLPADETVRGNTSDPGTFDGWIDNNLLTALKGIATSEGTYFTSATDAEAFLTSGSADGTITYLESSSSVEIAANDQIGSRSDPVVLVLDVPADTVVGLDFRGTADFYGIIVCTGDLVVRGTTSFYGSVITRDLLESKGNGAVPEIQYNGDIVLSINRAHTIGVNILPNSWQEYTTPK